MRETDASSDRRQHQRLGIRLTAECLREGDPLNGRVRVVTANVGAGGALLEMEGPNLEVGDRFRLELSLPAAEGVSPYPGRASCMARVVRVFPINHADDPAARFAVASEFLDRLRFAF